MAKGFRFAAVMCSQSISVSVEDIITLSALVGAVIALFSIVFAIYRWFLHQKAQDKIIEVNRVTQQEALEALKKSQQQEISELKKEQQLLTYGMLACLEGLKQLHCNGAVSEARDKLSKHLNAKAHE